MVVFEIHNGSLQSTALSVTSITANGTTNGNVIDTAHYEALEFLLISGTITDGAYAVTLQHGAAADGSDMANVDADEMLGDADFAATDDNTARRIGYIGKQRYVRVVITASGITTGGSIGAIALRAKAHHKPTPNN